MTIQQIKAVARFCFADHAEGTVANSLTEIIKAYTIPTEVEYFTPDMVEQSIYMFLLQKGELITE